MNVVTFYEQINPVFVYIELSEITAAAVCHSKGKITQKNEFKTTKNLKKFFFPLALYTCCRC